MVKLIASTDYINALQKKGIIGTGIAITSVAAGSAATVDWGTILGPQGGEPPVHLHKEVLFADHDAGVFYEEIGNGEYQQYVAEWNFTEVKAFFNDSDWAQIQEANFTIVPSEDGGFVVKAYDPLTKTLIKESKEIGTADVHKLYEEDGFDGVFLPADFILPISDAEYRTFTEDIDDAQINGTLDMLKSYGHGVGDAGFRDGAYTYTADASDGNHSMIIDFDETEVGMHATQKIGNYSVQFVSESDGNATFKVTDSKGYEKQIVLREGAVEKVGNVPFCLKGLGNSSAVLSVRYNLEESFGGTGKGEVGRMFGMLDGSGDYDEHGIFMKDAALHNTEVHFNKLVDDLTEERDYLDGLIKNMYIPNWTKANTTIKSLKDAIDTLYKPGWQSANDSFNRSVALINDFYKPGWQSANDSIANWSKAYDTTTQWYRQEWLSSNGSYEQMITVMKDDFNTTVEELNAVLALDFAIDNKYIFKSILDDDRLTPAEKDELLGAAERQSLFDEKDSEMAVAKFNLSIEKTGNTSVDMVAHKDYTIAGGEGMQGALKADTLLKTYALYLEKKAIYDNTTYQQVRWDWETFKDVYSQLDDTNKTRLMDEQQVAEFSDGDVANGEGTYFRMAIPDKEVYFRAEIVYNTPQGEKVSYVSMDRELALKMKQLAEG